MTSLHDLTLEVHVTIECWVNWAVAFCLNPTTENENFYIQEEFNQKSAFRVGTGP